MLVLGDVARLNARRYPDKKALIMGDRSLTFDQLNKLVNRVARGLHSMGVGPGDRVAIWSRNCMEFVAILFAVWKCGGIIIPINFRFKTDEAMLLIDSSKPKVIFHSEKLAPNTEEVRQRYSGAMTPVAISGESLEGGKSLNELIEGEQNQEVGVPVESLFPSTIMYTSGTTGSPKGVLFSHFRTLCDITNHAMEMDLKHEDTMLVNMPLFHNGGLSASGALPALRDGQRTGRSAVSNPVHLACP